MSIQAAIRLRSTGKFYSMDTIVVASDIASVRRDIGSLLEGPDASVIHANSGRNVLEIVKESEVDLVIADMQIGSMGGVAVCLEMRLQASLDVIDEIPVLLVLDRRPDVFQAKRSGADGWIVKPLDPLRIRAAAKALLNDGRYEDNSYEPVPTLVADHHS